MMRIAIIILTGVLLGGCQDMGSGSAGIRQKTDDNGRTEEVPYFVGRWAAREEMCADAAWELTQTRLSTPGHTVCTFDHVKQANGIFHIAATCTAEGPPAAYDLKISYAQSVKALLVEGGPMQPVGLVACR